MFFKSCTSWLMQCHLLQSDLNFGTVSKATLGKLLRDGVESIWVFPEFIDTILNWTSTESAIIWKAVFVCESNWTFHHCRDDCLIKSPNLSGWSCWWIISLCVFNSYVDIYCLLLQIVAYISNRVSSAYTLTTFGSTVTWIKLSSCQAESLMFLDEQTHIFWYIHHFC